MDAPGAYSLVIELIPWEHKSIMGRYRLRRRLTDDIAESIQVWDGVVYDHDAWCQSGRGKVKHVDLNPPPLEIPGEAAPPYALSMEKSL